MLGERRGVVWTEARCLALVGEEALEQHATRGSRQAGGGAWVGRGSEGCLKLCSVEDDFSDLGPPTFGVSYPCGAGW